MVTERITSSQPVFTVFTPTYNRAHTLHRVYDSLRAQTYRHFEWLVVDDGSTDDTAERVAAMRRNAGFDVRYRWQPNHGKHVAFNHGVREARGQFFLPLDSDDACVPQALERFMFHWQQIPAERQPEFSAVTALCMDENGRRVGKLFPRDVTDSDSLEMRYRFNITCEKWGFHRTEVLRQYPFPEQIRARWVPEAVVWSQIARTYKTRFVNEQLRIYIADQPSLMRCDTPATDAAATRFAQLVILNDELDYFWCRPLEFCRAAARYVRLSRHARTPSVEQVRQLTSALGRALWVAGLAPGNALYYRDQWATARRRRTLEGRSA
jgi:glycosyltransferase involved in cell wall biosynthesis